MSPPLDEGAQAPRGAQLELLDVDDARPGDHLIEADLSRLIPTLSRTPCTPRRMLENPRDPVRPYPSQQLDAGRIIIDPLGPNSLQPSSIDLRLDRFFRVFKNHAMGHIDVKQNLEELTELVEVPGSGEEPFILHPGEFVLGSTLERAAVPDDLVARLEGKSSPVVSDCSFTRRPASSTPVPMASSRLS